MLYPIEPTYPSLSRSSCRGSMPNMVVKKRHDTEKVLMNSHDLLVKAQRILDYYHVFEHKGSHHHDTKTQFS